MCYNINVPKRYKKTLAARKEQKWRCKLMEKMFSFTKREGFSKIAAILANAGEPELEQFVQHEMELLARSIVEEIIAEQTKDLNINKVEENSSNESNDLLSELENLLN